MQDDRVSACKFVFRAISYSVPWSWLGKAEKFENNEIHCNKQHWTDLLHGKAYSIGNVCTKGSCLFIFLEGNNDNDEYGSLSHERVI